MADKFDDEEISPYLQQPPRSQQDIEAERKARLVEAERQQVLDRALGRLSVDELRYEAEQLLAESRRETDPEQQAMLAERAFELAQLAERAGRAATDMSSAAEAAAVGANDNVSRLLAQVRRWRMRAEEYFAVADSLMNAKARDSYLHLARTYETLANQFEARAHHQQSLRTLRKI